MHLEGHGWVIPIVTDADYYTISLSRLEVKLYPHIVTDLIELSWNNTDTKTYSETGTFQQKKYTLYVVLKIIQ